MDNLQGELEINLSNCFIKLRHKLEGTQGFVDPRIISFR